ncbi:MAG: GNAT family N-acetyltransferase [Pseudomonadota bacterium]
MSLLDGLEIFEITSDNSAVMDNVADDLFDETVKPHLLASFLTEPTHWLVVAVLDGVVIGKSTAIVHKRPDKPDELYLDEIDVIPQYRRQGIAKNILDHMLKLADERDCEECWLGTEKDNIAARKLYESNGAKAEEIILYYLEY